MIYQILVIDDEPHMARLYSRILKSQGQVLSAHNVSEAWGIIDEKEGSFDAILCDLNMPRLTGADFFRGLDERAPELKPKVIFLTGGIFEEDMHQFIQSVDNPLLQKPFDIDELIQLIQQTVSHAQAPPTAQ